MKGAAGRKEQMLIIIGSKGQLGWELVRRGRQKGFEILAFDYPEIDITDPASVKARIPSKKSGWVINAAAYTAVDKAESEPDAAFAVNRDGPGYLARHCCVSDLPLIHISTDYVFDGSKTEAYTEQDTVLPIGVYGESKAAGETEIRNHLPRHIILRTAWLYGVNGQNFVKTILSLGRERPVVKVVSDQLGCPTYAADLADTVLTVIEKGIGDRSDLWGTYHYCGSGATTWYAFTEAIYKIASQYEKLVLKDLVPIKTADYPTPARRPLNSVLDCRKIEKNFGIKPRPWQEALSEMISDLYNSNPKNSK